MTLRALLARLLLGSGDLDGAGQSLIDDLRWIARFYRARQEAIAWRAPTVAERSRWDSHPLIGRFGDDTIGVATHGGREWVARDRLWFGWPDPPEFTVFALDGETIWLGRDFDHWPRAWGPLPAASPADVADSDPPC